KHPEGKMPVVSSSGNLGNDGQERCPQCQNLYGFYRNEERVVDRCGHASCWRCVFHGRRCVVCLPVGTSAPTQEPEALQAPGMDSVAPVQRRPRATAPGIATPVAPRRSSRRRIAVVNNRATEAVGSAAPTTRAAQYPSMMPVQCQVCQKTLSRAGNLQRHYETVHQNNKPYRCRRCPATFGQRAHLVRHANSHNISKTA
ncbi:MDS1 and EVI1 complex locus protein EVI1-B, partial [Orchesella cincta]